jgi:arylsulfatase A-like enzyme/tetratricopeptide (TPR) repeat protein
MNNVQNKRNTDYQKANTRGFIFLSFFIFALGWLLLGTSLANLKNNRAQTEGLNVLLITLDTIRADRLGYSGYNIQTPHLDALAFGGARFMNAVCQVPLTLPSHASILTGTNPPFHQIKNNGTYFLDENLITLAEILKQEGYQTAAFIGAFPLASQFGLDQGFDLYDDGFKNPDHLKGYEPQRIAEQVFDRAADWFDSNSKKKFFVWIHYYDPHLPYTPPPPFDKIYRSPYDGEITYTDVYVGRLIELLKEKNAYDNTLVVVVGDHGEGLGDHGEDTHGIFLYDTTLKVPLIFHSPGRIPKQLAVDHQVRTVDILPTVLGILNISPPKECQGKSLVPFFQGENIILDSFAESYLPLLACGWSELKAIRTNKWKFIKAPHPELYDLEKDPSEKINLAESKKDIAVRMMLELEHLEKSFSSFPDKTPVRQMTPEEQEKLAALGYVAGITSHKGMRRSQVDPKDKIQIFEDALRAELLLSQGKAIKARDVLKKLSDQEPENPLVHHFLGKAYQKLEEWDQSVLEFQKVLSINPDDVYSHFSLATSFYRVGKIEEAIQEAKIVLSYLGEHFETLMLLARIYGEQGNLQESIVYLEKAIRLQPDHQELRFLLADSLTITKEYDRAFEVYNSLMDAKPDDPRVHHGLGMVSYFRSNYKDAIKHFLKEIELHSNPRTILLLGISYGQLSQYLEALFYLEKYLKSIPPEDTEQRSKIEETIRFFRSKLS